MGTTMRTTLGMIITVTALLIDDDDDDDDTYSNDIHDRIIWSGIQQQLCRWQRQQ